MRYTSRTGFGKVDWPWWQDLVVCGVIIGIVALVAWAT